MSQSLTQLRNFPDKVNTNTAQPYLARYFNNMALCLVQMEKFETALIYFEKALEASGQNISRKTAT